MTRFALTAAILLVSQGVDAQWRPSGAVSGFMQIEVDDGGLGGGLLLELWESFGVFQLGFAAGVGAITGDDPDANRIFTPLAATVGIGMAPRPVGVRAYVRGGVWGGATNEGLRGGGFLSGGAALDIRLDDTLSLGIAAEAWRLWGELKRFLVVPALSLVWRL